MLFDNGDLIGAVGFRASDTWHGGVQITTLAARLAQSNIVDHRIYSLALNDEAAAFAFARSQVGKPYDWAGVFGCLAHDRDWQQDDAWFCSELAAATALAGNTRLLNLNVSRIVPGALELCPFLTLVG